MTLVWPRIPQTVASAVLEAIAGGARPAPAVAHAGQTWPPVGNRVEPDRMRSLLDGMTRCAGECGHPAASSPAQRVAFDRAAARIIREHMDITWAEAGAVDMWSFTSVVLMPTLTFWRFGVDNKERWVASDLTRHTWARLWWHAESFGDDVDVLAMLGESELNQILERRSIGGNANIVRAFSRSLAEFDRHDVARRELIRDVTKRLLRRLAYVDASSLSMEQMTVMCRSLLDDSAAALSGSGLGSPFPHGTAALSAAVAARGSRSGRRKRG